MWTVIYAPETADEAVEHMQLLLSDMTNDKMPSWLMHAT
jgi:hypothetical protein